MSVTATPFFSPEHASDTLTYLVQNATRSIDIFTPSASSWTSECGAFTDDDSATCAPGCTPSQQRNETFPLFPALLNALHSGISVRILTNDYGTADCDGTITMLQFLALNGAEVRYFTTTTFVHAKYVSIDNGTKISISSINWSKSSMTKNREAGAILSGSSVLSNYTQTVFGADWSQATPLSPYNGWSAEDLATITDTSPMIVTLPDIDLEEGLFATALTPITDAGSTWTIQASPDSAWETLIANLNRSTSTLEVAMYQVTTMDLCNKIIELHENGINVSLLVSSRVYDEGDCLEAQACLHLMHNAGVRIRKTSYYYSYR